MIDSYYLYIFNSYCSVENFCNVFYLKVVNSILIHICIELDFSTFWYKIKRYVRNNETNGPVQTRRLIDANMDEKTNNEYH